MHSNAKKSDLSDLVFPLKILVSRNPSQKSKKKPHNFTQKGQKKHWVASRHQKFKQIELVRFGTNKIMANRFFTNLA